ncbi:monosaccharide ABC transporter membrane protein (CUT2 family) [Breoghania corrubedonensis]|uniref:Monosaccharide ABC transporter membrane protein (CUT2 family) n=1 Tax=Breoghania corrubedonensis TaxID=665038 RepID=A0A2T5V5D9_9HYPH|nr:ABC transporter permease [Breoghania corrubedonensis]PTW58977.1 monosaccharide ABC transporter membrane protein (CUT2 family) [Breoghania corrubedonensis]
MSDKRFRLSHGTLQLLLSAGALLIMLGAIFHVQPNAMSYFGFTLLFKLSMPLVLAALAQMMLILLGDIDLSNGAFVGMVTCITAVWLDPSPGVAVIAYLAAIAAFVAMGWFTHARELPSIIVTLGASFIWLGIAITVLPSPGGTVPGWLTGFTGWRPPLLPMPIWVALIAAAVSQWFLMHTSFGTLLRATGGNARAVQKAGWSLSRLRIAIYAMAGGLMVASGVLLSGIITSGDPNVAPSYTLLTIGAVIVGGGAFVGGRVSPIGTVLGALTLSLAGSFLSFMHVPATWQIGAQGAILFLVLAGRVIVDRRKLA